MKNLTIQLTAIELHSDCCLVMPLDGVEPNESANHRREESVFHGLVGLLAPVELLLVKGHSRSDQMGLDLLVLARVTTATPHTPS